MAYFPHNQTMSKNGFTYPAMRINITNSHLGSSDSNQSIITFSDARGYNVECMSDGFTDSSHYSLMEVYRQYVRPLSVDGGNLIRQV